MTNLIQLLASVIVSWTTNVTETDNAAYDRVPHPGPIIWTNIHHHGRGALRKPATGKTVTTETWIHKDLVFCYEGRSYTNRVSDKFDLRTVTRYVLKSEWVKENEGRTGITSNTIYLNIVTNLFFTNAISHVW